MFWLSLKQKAELFGVLDRNFSGLVEYSTSFRIQNRAAYRSFSLLYAYIMMLALEFLNRPIMMLNNFIIVNMIPFK